jgi:hypothetical protein
MKPRRPPRPWARALGTVFAYAVLWPITRLLELFGVWPRAISRAMARMSERFTGYAPNEHDVLVCSYFKTGTNWTMQIATQIAFRGKAEFEHIHDVVPWLELPDDIGYAVSMKDEKPRLSAPTGLRVIKTHLPMSKLVYSPRARYIWVVRDPKDVFVSSYHFTRSTMLGPLMPSVRKWLDLYLSEDTFIGSWAEHLQGGWSHRDRDNVLFLTFEEMKKDLPGTVSRIAKLMGVELTSEEFEAVVRQSTYAHMKSIGDKFDTFGLSPPWAAPKGAMVRRGQSGTASELLTPADQTRIDDYWRAELQRIGSDFPYDESFCRACSA